MNSTYTFKLKIENLVLNITKTNWKNQILHKAMKVHSCIWTVLVFCSIWKLFLTDWKYFDTFCGFNCRKSLIAAGFMVLLVLDYLVIFLQVQILFCWYEVYFYLPVKCNENKKPLRNRTIFFLQL